MANPTKIAAIERKQLDADVKELMTQHPLSVILKAMETHLRGAATDALDAGRDHELAAEAFARYADVAARAAEQAKAVAAEHLARLDEPAHYVAVKRTGRERWLVYEVRNGRTVRQQAVPGVHEDKPQLVAEQWRKQVGLPLVGWGRS